MTSSVLSPNHVDEPQAVQDYAEMFGRVAADRKPVIVRRDDADLAAVVPLEHLELLQDMLARQEAEQLIAQLDMDRLVQDFPPPQSWFEGDEPQPF